MLIVANNGQNGLPLNLFEIWLDGNSQLERKALGNDGAANQILRRITPELLAKAVSGHSLRVSEIMGGRASLLSTDGTEPLNAPPAESVTI